jgi:hypothetical protein
MHHVVGPSSLSLVSVLFIPPLVLVGFVYSQPSNNLIHLFLPVRRYAQIAAYRRLPQDRDVEAPP